MSTHQHHTSRTMMRSMSAILLLLTTLLRMSSAFHVVPSRSLPSSSPIKLQVVGGSSSYLDGLSSSPYTASTPLNNVNGSPSPSSSIFASSSNDNDDSSSSFLVGVLGDLHIDPRKMQDYEIGRQHWQEIFATTATTPNNNNNNNNNVALVSLGDLGESKSVRPTETSELFAGTTECHLLAAEYLASIGPPYEVVGGNHDLEGIDEFSTDQDNLNLFLRAHNKPSPQFIRYIADKTVLVGLTSTVFRDAKYTSHEVTIDNEQIAWFEDILKSHSAADGWKVFVFTHAPPNGSGLRVLQENHVVNGCCWLNHSNEAECRKFIELVREHRCIKAWFSGHFHLGQDYQDSITFPTIDPKEGPYPNRGSCVFAQTSVMRAGTSRDGRQQSRVIRGNHEGFEICTVDHANHGALRVDATITYKDCNHEVGVYTHEDIALKGDQFFKVYAPCAGDELHAPDANLVRYNDIGELHIDTPVDYDSKAWWYMACGRVLGLLNGMMIEYDRSTLAPLGLVVGADELIGKRIAIIDSGIEECIIDDDTVGMEGADCVNTAEEVREQSLMLVNPETGGIVVVQPNEDGSYWRKIVRNKMIREKEKRRENAAKAYAQEQQSSSSQSQWLYDSGPAAGGDRDKEVDVVSSWGPYTSTKGTAKKTGVSGLTMPANK